VTGRRRRGLLLPSVLALAAFVVLLGLGKWQLDRKVWKEALIANVERRLAAPPEPLPPPEQWERLQQDRDEFRRVTLDADFVRGRDALVFATGSAFRPDVSGPGHWVFTPARVSGGIVMVNRGFVPGPQRPMADEAADRAAGAVDIVGVMRWPEAAGMFSPRADVPNNVWFVRDHLSMAAARGFAAVAPFYVEQESPVPPGGLPRPGPLTVKLRNDHLGYALTWFGLAGALAVVFLLWARRRES
jgi:surfeit locus 1 family protein